MNIKEVLCTSCKHIVPVSGTSYSYIKSDLTTSECKYCNWIKRNGKVPSVDGFSDDIVNDIVKYMLFYNPECLNDVADKFNISLDDMINITEKIQIGNKNLCIRLLCDNCEKPFTIKRHMYKRNEHHYCSHECYAMHKSIVVGKGKNNSQYNRIKTVCTNCGKEIEVIPYDMKKTNMFGDNNNFCSQECYWEYRGKYYINEKSPKYGIHLSQEQKIKMKEGLFNSYKNGNNRLNNKIQQSVNSMLDKNGIKYEREYFIKYYSIDLYLPDYNLMIEVMGDYWHGSPLKYNTEKYQLNDTQLNDIIRDKRKHTYVKKYKGIEILYLWEADIKEHPEMCESLILEYINKKGHLANYHSFNWEQDGNILTLKNRIIHPYQSQNISVARNILAS